ncbi:MAG: HigA family addiction module antitoxin [Candidatus Eremiobacteraeota bacterium]|nr:HigA family addiction module antitoxin [Candidatus Eremiobacteraeota bacterium]
MFRSGPLERADLEGAFIDPIDVAAERRAAAPHPGPIIKRDYLDVLGVDAVSLARQIDMDAASLGAMLAGRQSIDVDAAVRIARALQLPAEQIMRMQVQCDFAAVREARARDILPIVSPTLPQTFPNVFIRGRLACASDDSRSEASYFFQQSLERRVTGDAYAGLHALWRGDQLRVYDSQERVFWIGPVLHDFDGRVLLPFRPAQEWRGWFLDSYSADLAFGEEHAAFFESMSEV